MLEMVTAFVIAASCLIGIFSLFYFVFMAGHLPGQRSVICLSGRAENAELLIRSAALASRLVKGGQRVCIIDCGVEGEARRVIEILAGELDLKILPADALSDLCNS